METTESQTPPAAAPAAVPQPLEQIGRPAASTGARAPRTGFFARLPRRQPAAAQPTLWSMTLQWAVAAAIVVALAWATFATHGWIPILSPFDLVVHEIGHVLFVWAPTLLMQMGGSINQVALPLIIAAFFWWRRDDFAVIVLLAWAAESLNNVSIYVADAQDMVLSLVGDDGSGAGHDWHNILGTLGWLESTDAIANVVRTASVCLFIVALGLAALGFYRARRA
ncbi:MAG: hypothetical protein NTW58_02525 [Actinobacteria bacterium]|nr:hypothetical protein [Actinomycetota bacterium]